MTPHQIKAICHELGDLFTHKAVAEKAGVSPSVWSDYCNYDKPDTTLPLHRMFLVEDKLGRLDFTNAIAERVREPEAAAEDPRPAAAHALAALSTALTSTTEALSDNDLTEAEKRKMQENIAALAARVHDFGSSVAALPTGRVKLRAV